MSPLSMWWRTHPAEKLACLVIALVLVVLAAMLRQPTASPTSEHQATALPTALVTTTPAPAPSAAPSDGDVMAAADVARTFLAAWASYRWDDTPQGLADRVRPYVTDRMLRLLERGSGGGAFQAQQAASHEVATAQVTVTAEGPGADGRMGYMATIQLDIVSDGGPRQKTVYAEALTAHTSAGWRVDEVKA